MFVYSETGIVSAVPLADIEGYLCELGAVEKAGRYEYAGLVIEIAAVRDPLPTLGIPRHTVRVHGDKTLAEQFLTGFRFRFMSAGG